ncbi:N-acetyltransferase [Thalassotalea euphylliae]|uniref:N-acetyltransferase n=1 Tax=Thalassotalea euphylliae TaxID=1655234 RepID=A0A3E0TV78_9GAMM|nr:N-acetyltransferase [Thalassotalea euphylliae]REL28360.1 N-acetyltransferase [Thalassotalea euphylliae]
MKKTINIRAMSTADLPTIKQIIAENQLFPAHYLDEMSHGYFSQQTPEYWLVAECKQGEVVGVAYSAPEQMTAGTWNLLMIAVAKSHQGQGVGSQLMFATETKLRSMQTRILLVETSSLPAYELTRRFYPKLGYQKIATVPDYYDKGDDKVIFWKSLNR